MDSVNSVNYLMLGMRIRETRKLRQMTQEQLAEQAEISLSFLGHIERGSRTPSLETVVAICNVLNVSPQYLLQDSLNDTLVGLPNTENDRQSKLLREVSNLFQRYLQDDE